MNARVTEFFERDVPQFCQSLDKLGQEIPAGSEPVDDAILARLTAAIEICLSAAKSLEQELADDSALLHQAKTRFREAIQPWFSQSWCMSHALAKPRGYAGDYQMLIAVYNAQPQSLGLGGYLDRYFFQTELGTSVPLRLNMAREFLISEVLKRRQTSILNIASGPAREYLGGWDLPEDCRVHIACADLDEEALAYVQEQVVPTLPFTMEMQLFKHNALKIGNSTLNIETFGKRDVIYSVGLFDYIPDRLLVRMLAGLRESVAPGGVIYLAFKDSNFYDPSPYQWLVDWYFHQRTEAECRQLLQQAGYAVDELEMTRDDTGSIINYISRIPLTTSETTVPTHEDYDLASRTE